MKLIVEAQWTIDENVYLDMLKLAGYEDLVSQWNNLNGNILGHDNIKEFQQEEFSLDSVIIDDIHANTEHRYKNSNEKQFDSENALEAI